MTRRKLTSVPQINPANRIENNGNIENAVTTSSIAAILDRAATALAGFATELREVAGSRGNGLDDLGEAEAHGDRAFANDMAKPTAMNDDLMTASDVAQMLRIDVRTVRRRCHLGTLPNAIQIGKALRWKRKTIERWLKEQER